MRKDSGYITEKIVSKTQFGQHNSRSCKNRKNLDCELRLWKLKTEHMLTRIESGKVQSESMDF
jgi:hypothetical protein